MESILLQINFSKQAYLTIFGAILFGTASSFYLLSWSRLIQRDKFFKEWRFVLWSFGLFLTTLTSWWYNWDLIAYIDDNLRNFLSAFLEIGLFFVISAIVNPDKDEDPAFGHIMRKANEIIAVLTAIVLWSNFVPVLYGVPYSVPPLVFILPILLAVLWYILKKQWVLWLYLLFIYAIDVYVVVTQT